MSCMIVAPDSTDFEALPLPLAAIDELNKTGLEAMRRVLGAAPEKLKPPAAQFTGMGCKADGMHFYLTIVAPEQKPLQDGAWSGGFYVPFGHFHVVGSVKAAAAAGKDTTSLAVSAKLVAGGDDMVAADWSLIVPKSSLRAPNNASLIKSIKVSASGPHDKQDIRACIARHAAARSAGDPRAVVTAQCAVALSCLIEAIC